ncbi:MULTISPECIES: transcriptional regulator [Actinomyces]|uniref:Transcriptional regulator n=1 Tax=Actinomyces marmotae TaxID=2737173 RepID=A0A6M8BA76_9ACTO|nr:MULTISPECIES: transcriptional regulator [Actinomyces]QKD80341.1 transcriptional regulator [Actinomyces marmotae]
MSASAAGGPRRRRVVLLSPQDAARVARGEMTEEDEENARRRGIDALTEARARREDAPGGGSANDARLRAEVPPHWS